MDNHGFTRCDSEFETIGEDLNMSTMSITEGKQPYVMPDISRELALLDAHFQKSIKNEEDNYMLPIGTKVIVRTCDDYHGRHCGRVGTVCKYFAKDRKVGVMFEGVKNPASKDGVFWFQDANLTPYKEPSTTLTGVDVKNVIFSGNKTIVLWADGTKTIVACGEGDVFDHYAGFCAAVTKKMFGTTRNAMRAMEKTSKTTSAKKKETPSKMEG